MGRTSIGDAWRCSYRSVLVYYAIFLDGRMSGLCLVKATIYGRKSTNRCLNS